MMERRRRIETAFEIASALVYGGNRWRDRAAWCGGCDSYIPMVSLPVAATLDRTTSTVIFRRVEAGELHHSVTADGALLICLSSLLEMKHTDDAEIVF